MVASIRGPSMEVLSIKFHPLQCFLRKEELYDVIERVMPTVINQVMYVNVSGYVLSLYQWLEYGFGYARIDLCAADTSLSTFPPHRFHDISMFKLFFLCGQTAQGQIQDQIPVQFHPEMPLQTSDLTYQISLQPATPMQRSRNLMTILQQVLLLLQLLILSCKYNAHL